MIKRFVEPAIQIFGGSATCDDFANEMLLVLQCTAIKVNKVLIRRSHE
jgi:hypothetical protein